jgi:hypothetical protein
MCYIYNLFITKISHTIVKTNSREEKRAIIWGASFAALHAAFRAASSRRHASAIQRSSAKRRTASSFTFRPAFARLLA